MKRFLMGPISFGSTNPVILWQVDNVRLNPGIERLVQGAQTVDVAFAGAIKQAPMLSFDTPAISRIAAAIDLYGTTFDQVNIYFRQLQHGGSVQSGSKHTKLTLYSTLGLIRRISASQFSEATASVEIHASYDGTNLPLAITANQSLPAYSAASIEKFTVGPGELNGTDIDNIQSIDLDTGIALESNGQDGGEYVRFLAVREARPSITATSYNVDELSTIGVGGGSFDNAIFFLRALTNTGAPVADTTAGHVKLTATESHVTISDLGDTATINVQPVWDGTNDSVLIETGKAISVA